MFSFISCEKYPISALTQLPSPIDSWPYPWYLFNDELNTKGSMEPFVWSNSEFLRYGRGTLDLASRETPQSGKCCIKMTWIGANIGSIPDNYAGWGLMATELSGGKKDLSTSGYTDLKFYLRGNLSENCSLKIEIPTYSISRTFTSADISSSWQEIELSIPNVSIMTAVEYYLAVAMFPTAAGQPTNGGTIYIDNIRFCKD